MKFYRLGLEGECTSGAVEIESDWNHLSELERRNAYTELTLDGGGVRITFDRLEVEDLRDRKIITRQPTFLDQLMKSTKFEYFCLQSPPADASTSWRSMSGLPIPMVKFRDESNPTYVNIQGVSTNELIQLLLHRRKVG